MESKVPLVIYTPEGRKVIGEASFDGEKMHAEVTDIEAAKEILQTDQGYDAYSIGLDVNKKDGLMSLDFQPYIRKPFTIEAIEVTEENMEEVAASLEIGKVQPKRNGEQLYILVDGEKIPNVFRIYAGFFITRMGINLRAYSAKTFRRQFALANSDSPPQEVSSGT